MIIKKYVWLLVALVLVLVPISFADSHNSKKNSQSQEELEKLVNKKDGEEIKKDSTGDVTVTKKPNKKGAGSVAVTAEKDAHFKRDGDGTFTVTGRKKVTVTLDKNGKGADLKFRTDGPVETSLEKGKSYHPGPGGFLEVSIAADGTIKVTAMKITETKDKKIVAELEGGLEGDGKPITKKIISKNIAEISDGISTNYADGKMSHTYVALDTLKIAKNGASCKDCVRELPDAKAIEVGTTKSMMLQLHRHSQVTAVRVFNVEDNEVTVDITDHSRTHVLAEEPKGTGSITIQRVIDDGTIVAVRMEKGTTQPEVSGGLFPEGLVLSYRYSTEDDETKTQTYLYSAGEEKVRVAVDGELVGDARSIDKGSKELAEEHTNVASYVKLVNALNLRHTEKKVRSLGTFKTIARLRDNGYRDLENNIIVSAPEYSTPCKGTIHAACCTSGSGSCNLGLATYKKMHAAEEELQKAYPGKEVQFALYSGFRDPRKQRRIAAMYGGCGAFVSCGSIISPHNNGAVDLDIVVDGKRIFLYEPVREGSRSSRKFSTRGSRVAIATEDFFRAWPALKKIGTPFFSVKSGSYGVIVEPWHVDGVNTRNTRGKIWRSNTNIKLKAAFRDPQTGKVSLVSVEEYAKKYAPR